MPFFIAEVDDGFTVLEVKLGEDPEEVAAAVGGTVADAGPFDRYEDASDALTELEEDSYDRDRL